MTTLTTAQRVFKVLYTVSVPRTYLFPATTDEKHGTLAIGNEKQDAFQATGNVVVELSAAKLADMFSRGCYPTFAKPSTTPEMYRAILEHIQQHRADMDRNPNGDPELRAIRTADLVVLDEFAAWLYSVARKYISTEVIVPQDSLASRGKGRRVPVSRHRPGSAQDQTKMDLVELPARHTPLTEEIVQREFTRRLGFS